MMRNISPFLISCFILICLAIGMLIRHDSNVKPISYPEEIQAVRAGDTLIVSSVSDSIYIGFKHK